MLLLWPRTAQSDTLDWVMAKFVIFFGSLINRGAVEYLQEFLLICTLYRKCILDHPLDYLGKRTSSFSVNAEPTPADHINSTDDKELIMAGPKLANKFLLDIFPTYAKQLKK